MYRNAVVSCTAVLYCVYTTGSALSRLSVSAWCRVRVCVRDIQHPYLLHYFALHFLTQLHMIAMRSETHAPFSLRPLLRPGTSLIRVEFDPV